MRDEDLLKMVYLDSPQYRPEVLTYAKAEIRNRGISFNQADLINATGSMPDLPLAAFGFPFDLYQTGGFAGPTGILWGGVISDVAIAILVSTIAGWLLRALISRCTV
jgi:hypothetical protein